MLGTEDSASGRKETGIHQDHTGIRPQQRNAGVDINSEKSAGNHAVDQYGNHSRDLCKDHGDRRPSEHPGYIILLKFFLSLQKFTDHVLRTEIPLPAK